MSQIPSTQETAGTPSKEWAENTLGKAGITSSSPSTVPGTSAPVPAATAPGSEFPGAYPETPGVAGEVTKALESAGNTAAPYLPATVVDTVSNLWNGKLGTGTNPNTTTSTSLDPTSDNKPIATTTGPTTASTVTDTVKSYAAGGAAVVSSYIPGTQTKADPALDSPRGEHPAALAAASTAGATAAEHHEELLADGHGSLPSEANVPTDKNIQSTSEPSAAFIQTSKKDNSGLPEHRETATETTKAENPAVGGIVAGSNKSSKDDTKATPNVDKPLPPTDGQKTSAEHTTPAKEEHNEAGFNKEFHNPGADGYGEGYHPAQLHPMDEKYEHKEEEKPVDKTETATTHSATSDDASAHGTPKKTGLMSKIKGEAKIISGKLGHNEAKIEEGKKLKGDL